MNQEVAQCAQPDDEFSKEQWQEIDAVIDKFRDRPGALIPVLEEVQGICGYLPESIQRHTARGLDIPLSQVYGVVTFYSFFTMTPRGKHRIKVCLGTACHVRGAHRIVVELEKVLGIKPGETTADRNFSIEAVRCLGCCALAPVMVVDDDIHKQIKPPKLAGMLKRYQ